MQMKARAKFVPEIQMWSIYWFESSTCGRSGIFVSLPEAIAAFQRMNADRS
jgi:hypothetical protein